MNQPQKPITKRKGWVTCLAGLGCVGLIVALSACLVGSGLILISRPSVLSVIRRAMPDSNPHSFTEVSFGREGVSDDCQVIQPVTTVSQEALIEDQKIFFAIPFGIEDLGKTINIVWQGPEFQGAAGNVIADKELTLDLGFCYSDYFLVPHVITPGDYVFEVQDAGRVVYSYALTIEDSDLSNYPRPQREPLGNFTLGRDGAAVNLCRVQRATRTATQAEIAEDPWFYFVSSFTVDEIGDVFYWSVYGPGDSVLYDREVYVVRDDVNLCLWQGFRVGDLGPGKYHLVIENADQTEAIYEASITVQ